MNDALERSSAFVLGSVLGVALLVSAGARAAQSPDANTAKDRPMNHFVVIFRQRPGELTAEEVARRNTETHAWALTQNAAGHALDARILTAESELIAPERARSSAPVADVPVTAILFLEARDLADAVAVARAHPGLRFGASIEVRPWAPPPPRPAARP
jgi:hypothetical protein